MKNILISVNFLLAITIIGCEKEEGEDSLYTTSSNQHPREFILNLGATSDSLLANTEQWVNYMIPLGEHNNRHKSLDLFAYDSMAFYFSFDSTVVYETVKSKNQQDWNKLMGFSDCQSHHHQNSVRVVWRWTQGKGIEIGEYYYIRGQRNYTEITTVGIGDTVFASISATLGRYTIVVNNVFSEKQRLCNNREASYALYPYFGGDEAAPNDINIFVKHLYP